MKRIYFSGLILLFAIVAKAQQAPKPPAPPSIEERLKVVMDSMKVNMNLNEKQSAAIYEAFKKFFYDADQIKKPEPPPPPPPPPDPKVKAAIGKLEIERDEAVQKSLTPDQFKKYKETAIKLRPPGPPPPPQQIKK